MDPKDRYVGHTIPDVIMDINPMWFVYAGIVLVALVVAIFIAKFLNPKNTDVANYDGWLKSTSPKSQAEANNGKSPARSNDVNDSALADVEVGKIYEGRVASLMDFGAFVTILPGKDGLVHISQLSDERVKSVNDVLSEGDTVRVKVLEVDKQGRIRLSMRDVNGP